MTTYVDAIDPAKLEAQIAPALQAAARLVVKETGLLLLHGKGPQGGGRLRGKGGVLALGLAPQVLRKDGRPTTAAVVVDRR